MAEEKVIVISVAYRLGAFGFFSHPAFEYSNFGLMDLVESLRWINKNIDLKVATPKNVINTKIFLLGFGICKYTGGGMQLIKDPAGNDGNLNITVAQEFSKIDIIRNFFNLFNGSIFKERKVLTLIDKTAKISSKNADLVCQGDGEIFGAGKIEYSVVNKGLRYLS